MAAAHFDAVLARSPKDAAAAVGRANIALRRAEPDAVQRFRLARRLSPGDLDLALAEAEAELVTGHANPGSTLAGVVARNPGWAAGHSQLASIKLECGEGDGALHMLANAVQADVRNAPLWNAYITILAQMGDYQRAADAAAAARAAGFDDPMLILIEATHAGDHGDLDRSARLLAGIPRSTPARAQLEVRNAIRIGDIDTASKLLDRARKEQPFECVLWALTDIVWRLQGDPRAEWLSQQPGLISVIQLDLKSFIIEDIAKFLRSLHSARHQPLGQSVRVGTQTRGRLFDRVDPQIMSLAEAIQSAVEEHIAKLPPIDASHPLLRLRDRPMIIDGGWSVRLGARGHHTSHIHARGVFSSACYIALPALDHARQEGWLELGRPPDNLNTNLQPMCAIEPKVGQLVLFPSYMYHGTRPFDCGERLSVAVDTVLR